MSIPYLEDIVTVWKFAWYCYESLKYAGAHYREVAHSAITLYNVLEPHGKDVPMLETQKSILLDSVNECGRLLNETMAILEKYPSLGLERDANRLRRGLTTLQYGVGISPTPPRQRLNNIQVRLNQQNTLIILHLEFVRLSERSKTNLHQSKVEEMLEVLMERNRLSERKQERIRAAIDTLRAHLASTKMNNVSRSEASTSLDMDWEEIRVLLKTQRRGNRPKFGNKDIQRFKAVLMEHTRMLNQLPEDTPPPYTEQIKERSRSGGSRRAARGRRTWEDRPRGRRTTPRAPQWGPRTRKISPLSARRRSSTFNRSRSRWSSGSRTAVNLSPSPIRLRRSPTATNVSRRRMATSDKILLGEVAFASAASLVIVLDHQNERRKREQSRRC